MTSTTTKARIVESNSPPPFDNYVGADALLFSGKHNIKALRLEVPELGKEFSDTQFIGTGAVFASVRSHILMTETSQIRRASFTIETATNSKVVSRSTTRSKKFRMIPSRGSKPSRSNSLTIRLQRARRSLNSRQSSGPTIYTIRLLQRVWMAIHSTGPGAIWIPSLLPQCSRNSGTHRRSSSPPGIFLRRRPSRSRTTSWTASCIGRRPILHSGYRPTTTVIGLSSTTTTGMPQISQLIPASASRVAKPRSFLWPGLSDLELNGEGALGLTSPQSCLPS
ncbi:hypothetical protein B0H17DRAFT_1121615 [Mycena rosella]|uniref:Uncharacterized protein n=1 Tax=Mycena rosella TaxID=1033263 RepID=A0AAD7AYC9_MYCRO|nr:hypothetical protein B0H17DRAFT_1121615 [Mycena rosella]